MSRLRPTPGQMSLFPEPAAEVCASLRTWPEADLLHLAREVGQELIRRNRAVPVALPVGQAIAAMATPAPAM